MGNAGTFEAEIMDNKQHGPVYVGCGRKHNHLCSPGVIIPAGFRFARRDSHEPAMKWGNSGSWTETLVYQSRKREIRVSRTVSWFGAERHHGDYSVVETTKKREKAEEKKTYRVVGYCGSESLVFSKGCSKEYAYSVRQSLTKAEGCEDVQLVVEIE